MIKVLVAGAEGKMGKITVATLLQHSDFNCIAKVSRNDNLEEIILETKPDIAIDFTTPDSVFKNCQTYIKLRLPPVIGTSGLSMTEIKQLQMGCEQQKLGAIIAPNFSLSAILMMKYAKDAARYFPDVEIIEMHHPFKLDSPSGTANKTAHLIVESRKTTVSTNGIASKNTEQPARGDLSQGIPIHSVRLPGLFASQSVIFGGHSELLTIRHDCLDRQSCMPGVLLACKKVLELDHLIYGLENLI